jgi:hypothetical protein
MSPATYEFIFGVKLGTSALKTMAPVVKHEAVKLSAAVKPAVKKSFLLASKNPLSTSFISLAAGGVGYHAIGYSHYHQIRKVTQGIFDKRSTEIDNLSDKVIESNIPTLEKENLLGSIKTARDELELIHTIQDNSDYGCSILRNGAPDPIRFNDSSKELVQALKETITDIL